MRKIWKNEEGVSPVIAVILMVAITVVLAAVLYVMVSGMLGTTETTPKAGLSFKESTETVGKYSGTFDGSVKLDKIEIKISDDSLGDSKVITKPGTTAVYQFPGGLNFTFEDKNENGKIDAADKLLIEGGTAGDEISVIYITTGGTVARATLT